MRISKADAGLVHAHTRVRIEPDAIVLEVERWVFKPNHCMSTPEWAEAARLPPNASKSVIARARRKLLEDPQWFATCERCGGRQVRGWSYDDKCSVCPRDE